MGALKLEFSERAERQLDDILTYIALDNPDAAAKIAHEVVEILEKVREFPKMGKSVYPKLPYRELQAYPCRIFYRRLEASIVVVAILRGEQLLRRSMLAP
ncbi:MAG: type II toxin-antitoxin system RelE/ParE family toxin [Holophagaceae bacterium]